MEETKTLETITVRETLVQVASEGLGLEGFQDIATVAFGTERAVGELDRLIEDWDSVSGDLPGKEISQVLQGYCLLVSGKVEDAESVLRSVKRNPWGSYYLARAYVHLNRREEALAVAQDASEKHADVLELRYLSAELLDTLGRHGEAGSVLTKLEKKDKGSPALFYHKGYHLECQGEYEDAIQHYREAVRLDGQYSEAFFRLGYLLDLYGTEADEANDEAVTAYENCIRFSPVHTHAVLNLGVLYEDRERYHDAIKCYEAVIRRFPTNSRARLYLGDASASTRMFYDKDQEKRADKQSQVLKIPVSDFELSVRSRNCLQKMNIQTLGDLIMKTEQELLSYKNFGETSLAEIKEMLNQKGLRLGQGLDEKGIEVGAGRNPLEATASPEVLSQPIDELNLSVRSRRCMERLGVATVRDLINKTEVELMSAKNFGMTSLNEIKRKLTEMGLSLRS